MRHVTPIRVMQLGSFTMAGVAALMAGTYFEHAARKVYNANCNEDSSDSTRSSTLPFGRFTRGPSRSGAASIQVW
jgi:hypothetical protein